MSFSLTPEANTTTARAIFLTGSARTGSTMMGRLLNSLADVELTSDPSFLFCLFPMIATMDGSQWRYLFESYLFEEHLMQGLQGRGLNLNRVDLTSAVHSKPLEEIERRLGRSYRRREVISIAQRTRPAFKLTDMMAFTGRFQSYYPEATALIMVRRPESVIASTLAKGWYSDNDLNLIGSIWPFKHVGGSKVPFWVPDADVERFVRMTELERCVLYYVRMHEALVPRENCIVIDYDSFVVDSDRSFKRLTDRLGCSFGPLTASLLNGVKEEDKNRDISFEGIDRGLVERMYVVADQCKRLSSQW